MGGIAGLQATADNSTLLSSPASLFKLIEELPRVVQDAIHATRELNERYL